MLQALTETKFWMIEENFAIKWQDIIQHRLRNGKELPVFSADIKENEQSFSASQTNMGFDDEQGFSYYKTSAGNVARIPLKGTMTYDGGLCSYGTQEIAQMINTMNSSDDYVAAVLVIDTPGGDGASVEVLQNAINASAKPIVGWIEQTAASAGIWATTPVNFLMASSERFNTIGSIGGYMMYQNVSKALENEGIEVKIIRAPQSTNKVTVNAIEPLTEELEGEMVEELKSFVDYFINDVKASRQINDDGKVFTGKTYTGSEALALGLVDGIGSLESAVILAASMAELDQSNPSVKEFKQDTDMKFAETLNKIFGGEATKEVTLSERLAEVLGTEETELKVSEEAAQAFESLEHMITGYEAQLKDGIDALAAKQEEVDELDKEVLELGNENAEMDNNLAALKAENETLRKAPARNHTTVESTADVVAGDDAKVKVLTGYKAEEAKARQLAAKRAQKETQTQD